MKIGILGTRGIPNQHGGFEQFAEYFAVFLAEQNIDVTVYNSSLHTFQESSYKNIKIIKCKDPEDKFGSAGQFIYDLNCILDSRKRNFDIILQLGYTSNSVWHRLLPDNAVIVTNMDGLEWKRSKYSKPVKSFLKYAEKLAVKSSDYLISDSIGIQNYIKKTYNKASKYIAYGANIDTLTQNSEVLKEYHVRENEYFMLIARIEPENNIEVILDGYSASQSKFPFIVVGNALQTKFGKYLLAKYKDNKNISFVGPQYDIEKLNYLRYRSRIYFHGHSVGGTNPSLLEAMASGALIAAHQNQFNSAILEDDAFYFDSKQDVSKLINDIRKADYLQKVDNNYDKIKNKFNWEIINQQYLDFLKQCYEN